MSFRSHHGCSRCKKRRQKCDESRPTCARCLQAGTKCEYLIALKWNGRTPRQQTMRNRREVEYKATANSLTIQNAANMCFTAQNDEHETQAIPCLRCPIDPWNGLASSDKFLLNHFIHKASLNTPHAQIRDQICGQVVPMIFRIPSLFHATLALAGLHYATLLRGVPAGFTIDEDVAGHLSQSVSLLRHNLQGEWDITILHTIRTLCVCEIYSGKADNSWRVHVNGAKAIIHSALAKASMSSSKESTNSLALQWYSSIEALTALTARGLQDGKIETSSGFIPPLSLRQSMDCVNDYSFDVYTGYSSDLDPLLKEIGSLASERSRRIFKEEFGTVFSETDVDQRASSLEQRLLLMMSRDDECGLKLPTNVDLTVEELCRFHACNKAYQLAALIHIYRRLQILDSTNFKVQDSVREIISAVSGILPVVELSPWVLLTTPIYTAGCEAIGADRVTIRHLLSQLYETLRIRNTLRAISLLEEHWTSPTRARSPTCSYSNACLGDTLDFIPY